MKAQGPYGLDLALGLQRTELTCRCGLMGSIKHGGMVLA